MIHWKIFFLIPWKINEPRARLWFRSSLVTNELKKFHSQQTQFSLNIFCNRKGILCLHAIQPLHPVYSFEHRFDTWENWNHVCETNWKSKIVLLFSLDYYIGHYNKWLFYGFNLCCYSYFLFRVICGLHLPAITSYWEQILKSIIQAFITIYEH